MDGWMDIYSRFHVPQFFLHTQCPPKMGMCTYICLLLCLAQCPRVSVGIGIWGKRHHIISLGSLEWCRDWRMQTVVFLHFHSLICLSKRLDQLEVLCRLNSYTYRGMTTSTLTLYPHPPPSLGITPIDGMMKPCWIPRGPLGGKELETPWSRKSIASLWSGTFLDAVGLCFPPKNPGLQIIQFQVILLSHYRPQHGLGSPFKMDSLWLQQPCCSCLEGFCKADVGARGWEWWLKKEGTREKKENRKI